MDKNKFVTNIFDQQNAVDIGFEGLNDNKELSKI